ncbi:MAG: formylglycine-generating enzyme family protein [Parashewanella sp.]
MKQGILIKFILLLFTFLATFTDAKPIQYDSMVSVPAGKFIMGCLPSNDDICYYLEDETEHTVYLDAYQIDKYEVTYNRYQKCIDANKCTAVSMGGAMNYGRKGVEHFPVNGVTWYQADTFCKFEGKRLPTEAEWEKAARGTDGRKFPWGNIKPSCDLTVMDSEYGGNLGCGTGNVMNVGSKPKGVSPYGAFDMAGNVWEWTADWYEEKFYKRSPKRNPTGPKTGIYKVSRGSDFFSRAGYELRTTSRFPYYPGNISPAIGFRCAKSQ